MTRNAYWPARFTRATDARAQLQAQLEVLEDWFASEARPFPRGGQHVSPFEAAADLARAKTTDLELMERALAQGPLPLRLALARGLVQREGDEARDLASESIPRLLGELLSSSAFDASDRSRWLAGHWKTIVWMLTQDPPGRAAVQRARDTQAEHPASARLEEPLGLLSAFLACP